MPSIKKPNRMRKCAKKLDMERGNLKKTNNYDKGRNRK